MLKFFLSIFLIFPIVSFSKIISTFNSENMNIKIDKLASNLGIVWGMSFVDANRLIFTVKSGKVGILYLDTKKVKYIDGLPSILYQGQGGLMDIQTSPTFEKDNLLFFTYSKEFKEEAVTVLASAEFKNNSLENWKDILITKSHSDTGRHFGSRITFDELGHIYFSIGDRGVRANGQDLTTHAGTIVRLNINGTIPKDNPFVNQKNKLWEIYSYGHRNPQGLFYDKVNKKLWSIEHGPRGGDEINLIEKGLNYGWPIISYGKEYWNPLPVGESTHKKGMQQAIKYYIPSIAPSSLIVYRGNKFSKWDGNIFSGALKLRHLNRIVLDKDNKILKEERLLESLGERIRNVIQSPKENLLISTDNGNIYRLSRN